MTDRDELLLRRAGAFLRLEKILGLGEPSAPPPVVLSGVNCQPCRATVFDPPSMRWVCPMVRELCPHQLRT